MTHDLSLDHKKAPFSSLGAATRMQLLSLGHHDHPGEILVHLLTAETNHILMSLFHCHGICCT
jgi:hypothetical protein